MNTFLQGPRNNGAQRGTSRFLLESSLPACHAPSHAKGTELRLPSRSRFLCPTLGRKGRDRNLFLSLLGFYCFQLDISACQGGTFWGDQGVPPSP